MNMLLSQSISNLLQAFISNRQVNLNGVLQKKEEMNCVSNTTTVWMRVILRVTHRILWAGLDVGHVRNLGFTHNCVRDKTLNAKLHNLHWDIVLVGDVDKILEERTHTAGQVQQTHLSIIKKSAGTLSCNCSSYLQSVMWMQLRHFLVDEVFTPTIKIWLLRMFSREQINVTLFIAHLHTV